MKNLMLMVPMLHQGGFERVCVQTAQLLKDKYNVTILIFSNKDINYDVTGLNIADINVPSTDSRAGKVINVIKRIVKTRKLKRKLGIDITYSFGSSANLVNVFSRTNDKILTGLRCSTDMENPRQVRLFIKRSDRVLSCSHEIMRELSADYGYNRSSYIYNPLNTEDIIKKSMEKASDIPFAAEVADTRMIISVGRQDYIKGFWHLTKAFSIVAAKHPEARLAIMGAGNFAGCLKLAKELGVSEKVAFTGVRKNPFPYVAAASLYVLSSNHEGFPNALLEAMALGRPVVAADCKTGPREILMSDDELKELYSEDPSGSSIKGVRNVSYGVLLQDMDAVENYSAEITEDDRILAKAIEEMLSDNEKADRYGKVARKRADSYTPARYAGELSGILEDL